MKYLSKSALGLMAFAVLVLASEFTVLPGAFISQAQAVFGRPLTPVSFAGVARRTARRSIYASSAVAATAAVGTAAAVAASTQPVTVVQQPVTVVQNEAPLPIGSTLPSLPSGCDSKTVKNTSYFTCGGNWYRPAMQGGNIVYSVVADPQ